jgi:elongation factor G
MTAFRCTSATIKPFISSASNLCLKEILKEAECIVLQPIMNLEITTSNEYASKIVHDLTRRNSKDVVSSLNEQTTVISAKTPLASLATLSTDLRRITSGHTTFTVEFSSYEQISQKEYWELRDRT